MKIGMRLERTALREERTGAERRGKEWKKGTSGNEMRGEKVRWEEQGRGGRKQNAAESETMARTKEDKDN